jgi:hypothetical protein
MFTLLVVALQIKSVFGTVLVNNEAMFKVPPLQISISAIELTNCGVAETVTVAICPVTGMVQPFKSALNISYIVVAAGDTEITLLPEAPMVIVLGVPFHVSCVPGVAVRVIFTGIPAHVVVVPIIPMFVGAGFTVMVPVAFTEPQPPVNGIS